MATPSPFKLSIMAACLGLAACGGGADNNGDSNNDSPTPTVTPTPSPTLNPTPTPRPATSPTPTSIPEATPTPTNPPAQPPPGPTAEPDPAPLQATLLQGDTLMGSTFSVAGQATVLLANNGELSLQDVNKEGYTLYTFANDSVDQSACNSDTCITSWPPLLAADNDSPTAPLSLIERSDGNMQWALRGLPLYFFANEANAGEVSGEGRGGAWHTAVDEPTAQNENEVDGVYLSAAGKNLISDGTTENGFDAAVKAWDGWSLYTFDNDLPGQSNCNDGCLETWPALLAQAGDVASEPYSIIERTLGNDGETALQWAYHGRPLYFYAADGQAGSTAGNGVGGVWHLARPASFKNLATGNDSYLAAAGLSLKASVDANDDAAEVLAAEPADGYSLYTFANDDEDQSNCQGGCLTDWPALMAPAGAEPFGRYTLVERGDEQFQWAFQGKPLYFYSGDNAPGDTLGEGLGNGAWQLARPEAPENTVLTTVETLMGTTYSVAGEVLVLASAGNDLSQNVVDKSGFALYTFDNDEVDISNCDSPNCINSWPPLLATEDDTAIPPLSIITRDNGDLQWALRGLPLYFYYNDEKPGDLDGEGRGGVWHTAVDEPTEETENAANGVYFSAAGKTLSSSGTVDDGFDAEVINRDGWSLYTFDNDLPGQSNCNDGCLETWPALLAQEGDVATAPYSIIERTLGENGDTALQWAYFGRPLYFYAVDGVAGATLGDGIGGVWQLARPASFKGALNEGGPYRAAAGLSLKARPNDSSGEVITAEPADGLSLYTFENDNFGTSTCEAGCLENWPALMAPAGARAFGAYSIIPRNSGEQQWAYLGKPLYFYKGDEKPGDAKGDGLASGAWKLARPNVPLATSLTTIETLMGTTYSVEGGNVIVLTASGNERAINFVNKSGFSLYTFDNDSVGTSTCVSEGCITTWPPLLVAENDVAQPPFSTITREDGNLQWALRGLPLYFFANDNQPGDVNGEGRGGVWHTAVDEPTEQSENDDAGVYFSAAGENLMSSGNVNNGFEAEIIGWDGWSLYTFDNDETGTSNCNDACLAAWPAILAHDDDVATAPYSIIERTLGSNGETARQWAYQGQPLYFYASDGQAGATTGDGVGGVWHLARPLSFKGALDANDNPYRAAAGLSLKARIDDQGEEETSAEPADGFSLYTFDNDGIDGGSTCVVAGCLNTWPALMAPAGATPFGSYTLVERVSGEFQWAFEGKPLYFFSGDNAPGDTNGDAVENWRLARPSPEIAADSIEVELESLAGQDLFAPFEVLDNPAASGGQYIVWPDGEQFNDPELDTAGQVIINFTLSENATIQFDLVMNAGGDAANDSLWYSFNNGENWVIRSEATNGFETVDINSVSLSAGTNTLRIVRRKNGLQMDKLILSVSAGSISQ